MKSEAFLTSDLPQLPGLQPPDWGSLIPRFAYFIQSPHCHPIKITEGNDLVAIGTAMLHADTAWLACIVVHPLHRKKGLGNAITEELIANIDRSRFKTIYLDATDFGFPVYQKLGFELEAAYSHMHHTGNKAINANIPNLVTYDPAVLEQILEVDKQVSGEDRSGILADFIPDSILYMADNKVEGFYIPGWGDAPVIAITETAGAALTRRRANDEKNAILPSDNAYALRLLNDLQFREYRISRRMFLGEKRPWKRTGIYNRISGQLG